MIREKRNDAGGRQMSGVDCCGWHSYREAVSYITDPIVECSCPLCRKPFPLVGICECKAPVIALDLKLLLLGC